MPYHLAGKKIWVAGHHGMVGSAVVERLGREDCEIITVDRQRIDLRRQLEVEEWLAEIRPQAIIVAAAKVGGILANDSYPADFLYDNLLIEANIIQAAHRIGIEKLMLLGSSCIYPKFAPQPMTESALLTGPLEPTNEWYAIAKITGIKLCQAFRKQYGHDFISVMPTNLYGENDNFDLMSSHVVPALLAKTHQAKITSAKAITIWGTGSPRREFMYVGDLADALIFLMKNYSESEHINAGTGEDITIRELATLIAEIVGFTGDFRFDSSKPDGTPRKLMDSSRLLSMGWKSKVPLRTGLKKAYQGYLNQLVI